MANTKINFVLVGIKTDQFALLDTKVSEKKQVDFNSNIRFKLNSSARRIGVFSTFEYAQGKNMFIKLAVSCHFEVAEEAWNDFLKNDQFIVPVGFARHLSMLTVGTARGILHCKTEGTPYNAFLLPTINVTELVTDDLVFK